MGLQHEFDLQVFEEKTGIKPARGERLQILERISAKAFKLIKIIELERSGIRERLWHLGWQRCWLRT
jgi:hypothetical protein